jgi:hypothetical protein
MNDWLENMSKIVAVALGIFGINKAMNYSLHRRLSIVEDSLSEKLSEDECDHRRDLCPMPVRIDSLTGWMKRMEDHMIRIEAKIDRRIEQEHR